MRVHVESVLPAPPGAVWAAIQRSDTLAALARPLLALRPGPGPPGTSERRIPERWPVGVPVPLRLWAFGAVPLGPHTLLVESADDAAMTLQTRERGPLLRQWDHRMVVMPAGPGRARYADTVEIDAGLLTHVVAFVARLFFRHRHRRWQALARGLASGSHTS